MLRWTLFFTQNCLLMVKRISKYSPCGGDEKANTIKNKTSLSSKGVTSYRCIRNGFQLFWFKFYSFHPIFVDESRESDFHHLLKAHGLWIRISAGRRKLYCSKTFIICLKIGEVVCMLNTRMRTKIDIHNVSCHQIMGFKVPVLHKKIQTKNRPLQSN